MVNRNSKCHCGSGKKYKKCCLSNDNTFKQIATKSEQIKKAYSSIYKSLYTYAHQRDDIKELYEDACTILFSQKYEYPEDVGFVFNSYILKNHIIEKSKSTLLLDFYNTYSNRITNFQAHLLHSILTSHISLYRVESIYNQQIILKDIFTEKNIEVVDNLLCKSLKIGENYVANVMNIANLNIISEIIFKITNENIYKNLYEDIISLKQSYKVSYDNFDTFLKENILVFYYHILQIMCPNIVRDFNKLVKNNIEDTSHVESVENTATENSSFTISLSPETFEKIDAKYLTEVLDVLSISSNNNINKLSESGWVSAAEYHIKKINGENITQAQIAEKYNISPSTLGKRYKILKDLKTSV